MSAVMTAMFDEYGAADRVRVDLVRDGFPTDRVDLTAGCEMGRAAFTPAESPHERLMRHFLVLFRAVEERPYVERLAERIEHGGAAVTVHPRGTLETRRARELLERGHPLEMAQHDLQHQAMEHAAAGHARPWVRSFWIESDHSADCIYCRLFERDLH
ncbi:MAG: hypothetical protein ACRETB_12715 [Steroidobacteraceae bacterium]